MREYMGFQYKELKNGRWLLEFPSGWKTFVAADSEDSIKTKIEEIIQMFGG